MKTFFKSIIILASVLFVDLAFACETGGNQCTEYTMPTVAWGPTAAVKLGGEGMTLGQALSGADGVGGEKASKAWTFSEGTMNVSTSTSLVGDNIAGCTSCGDNEVSLKLEGVQKTVAGAANETFTNGGPASSGSESVGMSKIAGSAWGQLGGSLSIK